MPVTIYYSTEDVSIGTVSPVNESVAPVSGQATGSTAIPGDDYYFAN